MDVLRKFIVLNASALKQNFAIIDPISLFVFVLVILEHRCFVTMSKSFKEEHPLGKFS